MINSWEGPYYTYEEIKELTRLKRAIKTIEENSLKRWVDKQQKYVKVIIDGEEQLLHVSE